MGDGSVPSTSVAFEGDETFYVDLSLATGATLGTMTRTTVTVRDTDPLVSVDTPTANTRFIITLNAGGWAVDPTPDTGTGIDAVKLAPVRPRAARRRSSATSPTAVGARRGDEGLVGLPDCGRRPANGGVIEISRRHVMRSSASELAKPLI